MEHAVAMTLDPECHADECHLIVHSENNLSLILVNELLNFSVLNKEDVVLT